MPRTKPAEEQRADLLEAGRALFLSKGVAATSLEDITSYREQHDLHELLFRHGGHVSAGHHATHALVLQAISDLLASGVAAGPSTSMTRTPRRSSSGRARTASIRDSLATPPPPMTGLSAPPSIFSAARLASRTAPARYPLRPLICPVSLDVLAISSCRLGSGVCRILGACLAGIRFCETTFGRARACLSLGSR